MTAVNIHNDFRAQGLEICDYFQDFSFYLLWNNRARCHDLSFCFVLFFLIFNFNLALSLSSFTLIKRLFSSSLLSVIRMVSSTYLMFLMFLPPILIPAYNSSSLAFLIVCSAYRLNRHGDSRQPCHTSFSTLNQSVVPYRVLTAASSPTYRFLRKQVRWSGFLRAFHFFKSFPQFIMAHTVKVFAVVDETEVDEFLEFPRFLYDPANVGNLISGSSSFPKPSLDIWKFFIHIMLKSDMHDFNHDFTSMWDECNGSMISTFFSIIFPGIWDEDWYFPVLWPQLGLPDLLTYWMQHLDGTIL